MTMSDLLPPLSTSKFRVAICGAGIAGLAVAITIKKYAPSVSIDIYEAHDSIETPGVGISLWKQVHDVLIDLGLFEEFKQIITQYENNPAPKSRRSDIPEGGYLWWQGPETHSSMHRQQMVAILEKHLPASCTVHLRKRLVNYIDQEQQELRHISPILLEFKDGTTATADILVGADGIRSAVRKTMLETVATEEDVGGKTDVREHIDAVFTGTLVYRFLIPTETLRKESPNNRTLMEMTSYNGKGRFFLTFPIAQGTIINVVAFINDPNLAGTRYEGHWVTDVTRDEVIGLFDDFEPDAKAVIKLCENPSKWALHELNPLPFCVRKRTALVGDACHAMTPYYGAGAGQAIDDAYILGRLIAHNLTTPSRIPNILRIYEEIRFSFAQKVASLAASSGRMFVFMEPGYYDGTRKNENLDENGISAYEKDGMEILKREILRRWEWVVGSRGAVEAWKEAEEKLEALAGQTAN